MDCRPSCSSVHGILQARIPEWVAIPFSRGLPNGEIKLGSLTLQVDSLPRSPRGSPYSGESSLFKKKKKEISFIIFFVIYSAVLGLSCGMQDC